MPVTQSGGGDCGAPVVDAHKLSAENTTFDMVSSTSFSFSLPFRFDLVTGLDVVLVSDGDRSSSTAVWLPPEEEDAKDREIIFVFVDESVGKF